MFSLWKLQSDQVLNIWSKQTFKSNKNIFVLITFENVAMNARILEVEKKYSPSS
jgi:hypothetical protein